MPELVEQLVTLPAIWTKEGIGVGIGVEVGGIGVAVGSGQAKHAPVEHPQPLQELWKSQITTY